MIARRFGRLGNRLTLFCNLVALAEEHGCHVRDPTFHRYAGHFRKLVDNLYCEYPRPARRSAIYLVPGLATLIRGLRLQQHITDIGTWLAKRRYLPGVVLTESLTEDGLFGPEPAPYASAKVVLMRDWTFRVPHLVVKHGSLLRDFFRPIPEIEQGSTQAAAALRERADLVVGVHIRQGDYSIWLNGRYFYPLAQYREWMQQLADRFAPRSVAFLVCTDSKFSESDFPGLTVGFGPGNPAGDLYALSCCDRLVGPVSTFSFWASFYGNVPLCTLRKRGQNLADAPFAVSDLSEIP